MGQTLIPVSVFIFLPYIDLNEVRRGGVDNNLQETHFSNPLSVNYMDLILMILEMIPKVTIRSFIARIVESLDFKLEYCAEYM